MMEHGQLPEALAVLDELRRGEAELCSTPGGLLRQSSYGAKIITKDYLEGPYDLRNPSEGARNRSSVSGLCGVLLILAEASCQSRFGSISARARKKCKTSNAPSRSINTRPNVIPPTGKR